MKRLQSTTPDTKYLTIKREDWERISDAIIAGQVASMQVVGAIEEAALVDSVVIRMQDVFAPLALDSYANNILTAITLADPSDTRVARLREIADYFHTKATESWQFNRKVPD